MKRRRGLVCYGKSLHGKRTGHDAHLSYVGNSARLRTNAKRSFDGVSAWSEAIFKNNETTNEMCDLRCIPSSN